MLLARSTHAERCIDPAKTCARRASVSAAGGELPNPSFVGLRPASEASSRCKRSNRKTNTTPEMLLRSEVWRLRLRYRKHAGLSRGSPTSFFARRGWRYSATATSGTGGTGLASSAAGEAAQRGVLDGEDRANRERDGAEHGGPGGGRLDGRSAVGDGHQAEPGGGGFVRPGRGRRQAGAVRRRRRSSGLDAFFTFLNLRPLPFQHVGGTALDVIDEVAHSAVLVAGDERCRLTGGPGGAWSRPGCGRRWPRSSGRRRSSP